MLSNPITVVILPGHKLNFFVSTAVTKLIIVDLYVTIFA